jgi:hypothetical protein
VQATLAFRCLVETRARDDAEMQERITSVRARLVAASVKSSGGQGDLDGGVAVHELPEHHQLP